MHLALAGWESPIRNHRARANGHGNACYRARLPGGYRTAERDLQLIRLCEHPPERLVHVIHFIGLRNNADKAVFFEVSHDRVV